MHHVSSHIFCSKSRTFGKSLYIMPVTAYDSLYLNMSFGSSSDPATIDMRSAGGEYPRRSRLGSRKDECAYYRMGKCKFGIACRFHHPRPAAVCTGPAVMSVPPTASPYYLTAPNPSIPMPEPIWTASHNLSMPMFPNFTGSYVPEGYGPVFPAGAVPVPSWTPYSAPLSPALSADGSVHGASTFGLSSIPRGPRPCYPVWAPAIQSSTDLMDQKFPQRPGQPECMFYMRSGFCKYGLFCKFHHPPDRYPFVPTGELSPIGLPLRPEMKACPFYMRRGYCGFGSICKFNHPMLASSYVRPVTEPSGSALPSLPASLSPDNSPRAARILSSEAASTSLAALSLSETPPASPS